MQWQIRIVLAYKIASRIMDTYQNSDSVNLWMVDEELEHTYEIWEKLKNNQA